MMLYLLLTLKVASAQIIEVPTYVSVSLYEPEGLYVQWRTVNNHQINPIIGYKIRVWHIEEDLHGIFALLNGDKSIISDERSVEPYKHEVPTYPPQEYTAPQVDKKNDLNIIIQDGIKYNTLYEVRILAYRKDMDGPMSEAIRVKIVKGDGYMFLVKKTSPDKCEVTSISEQTPENGVQYYYMETVHL